jgi:hypothetical protein
VLLALLVQLLLRGACCVRRLLPCCIRRLASLLRRLELRGHALRPAVGHVQLAPQPAWRSGTRQHAGAAA